MNITTFHNLLEYRDGALFWKRGRRGTVKKGTRAGHLKGNGYREIKFGGTLFYEHRVIWMMHHGTIPKGYEVDHLNGIRDDNRIENLRCLTKTENLKAATKRPRKNNTTGVPGVYFNSSPKMQGFVARIGVDGKKVDLGFRKDFFEAVCLRKSAEVRYGYADL